MHKSLYLLFILLLCLTACSSASKKGKNIITMAPSLSALVCAFQQNSEWKLVAVDKYSIEDCAESLPKVDPMGSAETIAAYKPDLVLMHSSQKINGEKLRTLGIDVAYYDMDTIPEIERATKEIAQIFDKAEVGELVLKTMTAYRSQNKLKFAASGKLQKKILIIVDKLDARMQQFYIATEPTYLAELVKDCGLDIVTPDNAANSAWTRISSETLIELNPSNILFLAHHPQDAAEVTQAFKQNYPMLDAVKNDGLVVYDDPHISIPGPMIFREQEKLCHILRQNALEND